GSTLIGALVSAMLYGITNLQTYIYYMHYDDASTMKFLVAAIWVLDTLHFSFMCHTVYYYLVKLMCLILVTVLLSPCR
ncbi:hypothetical protein F5J12DRAFT_832585, partial [Pisolithus orientalis]|uniref:uncharacterized protein n=1 Tax=Pisolithus orientalis TaxID=936130 RepID=UPI002224D2B3